MIELSDEDIHLYLEQAIAEADRGWQEGGIPIGSVLVKRGQIIGRGHNRRVQKGSSILHAEMDCFENAGRLSAADYQECILFSTLSPCDMCSGASLLYKIPFIVIGENTSFRGPEEYLRQRGVRLHILNDNRCISMMNRMIVERRELWFEDIGEPAR